MTLLEQDALARQLQTPPQTSLRWGLLLCGGSPDGSWCGTLLTHLLRLPP
jgi:hypothetical protein